MYSESGKREDMCKAVTLTPGEKGWVNHVQMVAVCEILFYEEGYRMRCLVSESMLI